MTTLAAP